MSKSAKIWLISATILVGVGLVIFAIALNAYGWDFSKLGTETYETNTYNISEAFDSISIEVDTTDITFVPADDENCRIVCGETEKIKHSATAENGVLKINVIDTRKWYDHIGIYFTSPKMTVYLPNDKYDKVSIENDTGNIDIPKDFSFTALEIEGDTGDVDCNASVLEAADIELDSGNVEMNGIAAGKASFCTNTGNITLVSAEVKGTLALQTDTGRVKLTDVDCVDLKAVSDTGDMYLKNVVASGRFSIKADTGDIHFDASDAQEIFIVTDTGDVKGSLLTEKVFITESDTGRVNVPKTVNGGRCEITTNTGDIRIQIR